MIASLTGVVAQVGLDHVVLVVGGVGMRVHTTPRLAGELRSGMEATVATTLVVREESLTLYGFGDRAERDMFETVQTVSGVGPRLALALLAVLTPDDARRAIATSDTATLTKVPGIGKKGAERICLELRDKVGVVPEAGDDAPAVAIAAPAWGDQVTAALVGLGYTAKQAEQAVEKVGPGLGENPQVSAALRAALQELGR